MTEFFWGSLKFLLGATVVAPFLCFLIVHFVADVYRNRLDSGRYKPNKPNGRSIFYGTLRMYKIRGISSTVCLYLFLLPALLTGFATAISSSLQPASTLFLIVMFGTTFGIGLLSLFYSKLIWLWIYKRNPDKFDQLEYDLDPPKNKRPGGFRRSRFKF